MKKRIVSILLCVALACANSSMAHGSELPESDYGAGIPESLSEENIPTELISEDFAETTGTAQEPGSAIDEDMSEGIIEASTELDTAYHTQSEIQQFVCESGASENASVRYSTEPVTTEAYNAGILSDDSLRNALSMLNNFRYIAGLDYNIRLDSIYTQKAQAAALLLAVNEKISHAPEKPSDMPDSLYDKGYNGAQNAVLDYGSPTLGTAILTWLRNNSEDWTNIDTRTALLKPSLGKVGFGAVGNYYAAYTNDASAESEVTKVAWPARNMPLNYFSDSDRWSVSGIDIDDISKLKVTLIRTRDNQTWTFYDDTNTPNTFVGCMSWSDAADSGYFSCSKWDRFISFQPNNITYAPGDVFEVYIEGLSDGTLTYTVSFFELEPSLSAQLTKTSLNLEYGMDTYLYYRILPEDAVSEDAVWSSSDPSVCSVTSRGHIKANNLGTAVISLQMGNSVSECTVTVTRRDIEFTTGFLIEPQSFCYSGAKNTPGFSMYSVDYAYLTEGTDYTLSYRDNVKPGTGTIIVTGIGNYTGTASYTFDIYPFEDVRNTEHPYYSAICWAAGNGISKGYSDTHDFRMNDACTRGQAIQFLWRMAGRPKPSGSLRKFVDVPKTHPFYNAILWASGKNIAKGYSSGEFRPDKPCTRGQACAFIWRYFGSKEPTTLKNPYKDPLTKTYQKAILWMTEHGLANGYTDKTFRDTQTCTRGMMIKYLYNSISTSK